MFFDLRIFDASKNNAPAKTRAMIAMSLFPLMTMKKNEASPAAIMRNFVRKKIDSFAPCFLTCRKTMNARETRIMIEIEIEYAP